MTNLHYSAIDANGVLHHGYRHSLSRQGLAAELDRQGLTLIRSRRSVLARFTNRTQHLDRRCDAHQLALSSFQLGHLLGAGVPLLDALDELIVLEQQSSQRQVLTRVRDSVSQGQTLCDALTPFAKVFGARFLAMIRVGEASGTLSGCLLQLEANLRTEADSRARLKNLMIYPLLAVSLVLCSAVFLLGFVVPELMTSLASSAAALPWSTRQAAIVSDVLLHHGPAMLMVGGIAGFLLWPAVYLCPPLRMLGHRWQLSMGLTGTLYLELSLSRYTECLALLYSNGIALVDAMKISEHLLDNRVLRAQMAAVRYRILNGERLAEAMSRARWLPGMLVRLVAAGESAGALSIALRQAGEQMRLSARHRFDRIEKVLPTVVLCIVGVLLLLVVVVIVVPVYDAMLSMGMHA